MKRFVSTALTVALLLGLGILAMLARGGGALLPPTRTVPVALAAPQTAACWSSLPCRRISSSRQ